MLVGVASRCRVAASRNARRRAVVGEGPLELDPLADGQQHVALCCILGQPLLSWSFPACCRLAHIVLLLLLQSRRRVSGGLTAPGRHRQEVGLAPSYVGRRLWASSSPCTSSSLCLLSAAAPVQHAGFVGYDGDLHGDDGGAYGDGARASH